MDKVKELERLTALEKSLTDIGNEAKELRKLIEAPSPEKKSAKQWLVDFLNQDFKTRFDLKGQRTVHYLGYQWVFWVDRKNKILWVHFDSAWNIFYVQYGMNYGQVKDLMREVVLEPLNCEGYTPNYIYGFSN